MSLMERVNGMKLIYQKVKTQPPPNMFLNYKHLKVETRMNLQKLKLDLLGET
jgi:hypothetical protein